MVVQLPPLKPRANSSGALATRSEQWVVPQSKEWEAQYLLIRRLYVCERRKLRYVIQYMQQKHGWRASPQMYKKKFTKWGFLKNTKHRTPTDCSTRSSESSSSPENRSPEENIYEPVLGLVGYQDNIVSTFLTNVRILSMTYYDSPQARAILSTDLAHQPPSAFHKKKEHRQAVGFTFKMAVDLLNRGHGVMAGRVTRKAFLMVEDLFTLDSPALLWNLLELMHHMLLTGQATLFHLMLTHLIGLMKDRLPPSHPVPSILRGLWDMVLDLKRHHPIHGCCSMEIEKTADLQAVVNALRSLVAQAWKVNADIVFDRFDTRLFGVYSCIHYSCSIEPPNGVLSAAKSWLDNENMLERREDKYDQGNDRKEDPIDRDIQVLYESVELVKPTVKLSYAEGVSTLRKFGRLLLEQNDENSGKLLPILAALVCNKVIQGAWPLYEETGQGPDDDIMTIPQLYAGVAACIFKTLLEVTSRLQDHQESASREDVLTQLRHVIALRSFAHGESDPQTVLEIWSLRDELIAQLKFDEALKIQERAFHLLDMFVEDVPIDTAY